MSECAQEIKWLRYLLAELGMNVSEPTHLHRDNISAQEWAQAELKMKRAKHIDTRYHFIRFCVHGNYIKLRYTPSAKNAADGFTKPLDRIEFEEFRKDIGVQRTSDEHSTPGGVL